MWIMSTGTINAKAGQTAAAPKVEMDAKQIESWKKSCEPKTMEAFISGSVTGDSAAAKEIRKASAVLARLSILKDSAEAMEKAYGTLYRWVWQGVAKKDGDVRLKSMSVENCSSWKWIMQLNVNGEWWDWVSVRPSSMLKGINLGVFAERKFPEGSTIGFYSGKVTWTCKEAGTQQPTDEYLGSQGVEESLCGTSFLNTQAVYVVVEPTMMSLNGDDVGECLYMGMHYLVSPELGVGADPKQLLELREQANCQSMDDGSVMATSNVSAGSKLLELVNPVETADSEEEMVAAVVEPKREKADKKPKSESKSKLGKKRKRKET